MSEPFEIPIGSETEVGHHCLDPSVADPGAAACEALTRAHHETTAGDKSSDFPSCFEFDSDGFRCYPDHLHFECSTPLVNSSQDFVLVQRLLRKKLLAYKSQAEKDVGPMRVYFNNTNRKRENGTSWGHHVNVRVSREAFLSWAKNDWTSKQMLAHYVPWVVSSIVLTGSGKVGSENGASPAVWQLSQRSDWTDRYSCLTTTDHKSILNQRDEPLSSSEHFARLHSNFFDTPRAEFATFLRMGMIQCVLAAIENQLPLPDLQLKVPLVALAQISRDMSFSVPLALSNGKKATALEVQYRMAEAIQDAILADTPVAQVPHAQRIAELWIQTLDDIASRAPVLIRRLDWRARLEFIRKTRPSDVPESDIVSDLQFGEVGGVFDDLEAAGAMDILEDFLPQAPAHELHIHDRERARATLLDRFSAYLLEIDWHQAFVRDRDDNPYLLQFDGQPDCARLLQTLRTVQPWDSCIRRLLDHGYAVPCEFYEISIATGEKLNDDL